MKITRRSVISGKKTTMDINITQEQLEDWTNHPEKLMIEALPHLSSDERDFLLTGITPEDCDEFSDVETGESYANAN